MPRTCIICGGSANSREHIFPAGLGGLRLNRGIYCEQHNNAFSDQADIPSFQFGILNAQHDLGVTAGSHTLRFWIRCVDAPLLRRHP